MRTERTAVGRRIGSISMLRAMHGRYEESRPGEGEWRQKMTENTRSCQKFQVRDVHFTRRFGTLTSENVILRCVFEGHFSKSMYFAIANF